MKLAPIQTFEIENADEKQFHRIIILNSGTVAGFYSQDDNCFLQWINSNESTITQVEDLACDTFATPAFFHFQNYVGLYSSDNDFIILYNESNKNTPIKIALNNHLPQIKYLNFNKDLPVYHTAGNTDSNIVPVLFSDGGLLPVYIAQLQIDIEKQTANWLNLQYWNNKQTIIPDTATFDKPAKPFVILHALNKQQDTFAYGIGNREAGYLKPGMEFSELVTITETGVVKETFFSLGRLYKESKKGGKECTFSSSGKYAILTPAFKSDDWKNNQKLFDLERKALIDLELPKGYADYRVIDHNNEMFLLVNKHPNLIFANTDTMVLCKVV